MVCVVLQMMLDCHNDSFGCETYYSLKSMLQVSGETHVSKVLGAQKDNREEPSRKPCTVT